MHSFYMRNLASISRKATRMRAAIWFFRQHYDGSCLNHAISCCKAYTSQPVGSPILQTETLKGSSPGEGQALDSICTAPIDHAFLLTAILPYEGTRVS